MTTYARTNLSGSVNGKGIKVAATGSPGTTIHTAVAGTDWDEIWIYAYNSSGANVTLTLQWGGTADPDNDIVVTIPPAGNSVSLIIPGWILQNSLVLKAFAGSANVVILYGFVNRITA